MNNEKIGIYSIIIMDNIFDFAKASMMMGTMNGQTAGSASSPFSSSSSTTGSSSSTYASGPTSGLNSGIMAMIYLSLIQFIFKLIEQMITIFKTWFEKWWADKMKMANEEILKRASLNTVLSPTEFEHLFERAFESATGSRNGECSNNTIADAIMYKVMNCPSVKSTLKISERSLVNNKEKVSLTPTIYFELIEITRKSEGISGVRFKLVSAVSTLDLIKYEEEIKDEYWANKNNSLGTKLYFFDQVVYQSGKDMNGKVFKPPIRFTKHEFKSNRQFTNVFFEGKDVLEHRFRFFLKNKDWYDERGIPYTLGMLFHGPPGCGKTSSLKAIANESGRHIININLKSSTSKKALKNLFYSPFLEVVPDDVSINVETYFIPAEKRIFVIEDADAILDSILLDRTIHTKPIVTPPISLPSVKIPDNEMSINEISDNEMFTNEPPLENSFSQNETELLNMSGKVMGMGNKSPAQIYSNMIINEMKLNEMKLNEMCLNETPSNGISNLFGFSKINDNINNNNTDNEDDEDALDLSTILNILDGTLEIPGRILIVSSNHADRFDKAFLRPGRIDLIVTFKLCNRQVIRDMFNCFYLTTKNINDEEESQLIDQIPEYLWTPAEVVQILFKHFYVNKEALIELATTTPQRKVVTETLE